VSASPSSDTKRAFLKQAVGALGQSSIPLCDFLCVAQGSVEEQPQALQADFAKRYIRGGVLDYGGTQEEIR
jgi:hypothetical protein